MNDLSKRILCCIAFLLIVATSFGQDNARQASMNKPSNRERKNQFGLVIGVGQSKLRPILSNWNQGTINYNDSLNGIEARSIFRFELGFIYQLNFSKFLALRPAIFDTFEGGQLLYNRKQVQEKRKIPLFSCLLSVPLIIKYPGHSLNPYMGFGPTVAATLAQKKQDEPVYVPLKHFDVLGDLLAGIEWKSHGIGGMVSTELRYSHGFLNVISNANSLYTNTIQSLSRQAFTFSICLRH